MWKKPGPTQTGCAQSVETYATGPSTFVITGSSHFGDPPCWRASSICRPAKGWAPTGFLARKATDAGYQSVAHYLISTHQRRTGDHELEEEEEEEEEEGEGGKMVDNATQRARKRKAEGEPDLNANNTRELKKGAIVACWADPSSGDVYWLARGHNYPSSHKHGNMSDLIRNTFNTSLLPALSSHPWVSG